MDHLVVAVTTVSTIAVVEPGTVVGTAADAMTTATVVPLVTMIVNVVPMGAVMITHHEALIVTLLGVVMIAIPAVATIIVVGASLMVEMGAARGATAIHQETLASPMVEVETKTSALTIGTPVVDCGPLIHSGAERSAK